MPIVITRFANIYGPGQLNFSAGYSGLLGFTGGGGFSFPNFIGTGQSLSFNYQRGISNQNQSSIPLNNTSNVSANQQFSISYVEPRLFNTHNLVGFQLNIKKEVKAILNLLILKL